MELKHPQSAAQMDQRLCLNRTFYGIETIKVLCRLATALVLIVPFMELKRDSRLTQKSVKTSLNRTFYGIETNSQTP